MPVREREEVIEPPIGHTIRKRCSVGIDTWSPRSAGSTRFVSPSDPMTTLYPILSASNLNLA